MMDDGCIVEETNLLKYLLYTALISLFIILFSNELFSTFIILDYTCHLSMQEDEMRC